MRAVDLPVDEIVARGARIYDQKLRSLLEPEHIGKYLVIDIESGDYEMDEDHLTASDRVLAKHPEAVLYAMRIGYKTIGRIGGGGMTKIER